MAAALEKSARERTSRQEELRQLAEGEARGGGGSGRSSQVRRDLGTPPPNNVLRPAI
jgi:hypothetical protein